MTRINIYLNKSIEENAGLCYEKAKKMKKKTEGAEAALEKSRKLLKKLEKEKKIEEQKTEKKQVKKEKKWYEKFHWFISSEGFLILGGRDSTTNEILIKKHTDKNDLVLHTDLSGSPFFVIKSENKEISKATIKEAADAVLSYSKAWKMGLSTTPVFYVKPEQVSKKARPGEYLTKGAFMIYGKTEYIENKINLAIGITKGTIMAGPVEAISKNCEKFVEVLPGREKTSAVAKKIQHKIGGDLDDIIRVLPSGGCEIKSS